MLLESGYSEEESFEGEVSFPRENFHFLRSDCCSEVRLSCSRVKEGPLVRGKALSSLGLSHLLCDMQPQGLMPL